MPKSRNRKNHKKKVAARRQRILDARRRMEKQQREFLMQLIEMEKQKGLFNDNGTMSGPTIETDLQIPNTFETVDGPTLDGPSI
jgi:hypothetical protein